MIIQYDAIDDNTIRCKDSDLENKYQRRKGAMAKIDADSEYDSASESEHIMKKRPFQDSTNKYKR